MYEARQNKEKENKLSRNIIHSSKQFSTIEKRKSSSFPIFINNMQPKTIGKVLSRNSILSYSSNLMNIVISRIVQKKDISKMDAQDYKVFEGFLIKQVAYFIFHNTGNSDADANYFNAEKIVRQKMDKEAKIRAYLKWEKDGGGQQYPKQMDEQYFDALKQTIASYVLTSTDPSSHPETAQFILAMKSVGILENEAMEIWNLILKGIKEQETQNAKAILYDQNQKPIFTSDLDVIRNQNVYYRQLKDKIKPLLMVDIDHYTNKQKLALWTGGYDLSSYAETQGCKTLETTKFGKVIDNIYMSNKWPLIGPLWNIISETFVEEFTNSTHQNKEVHIYIRAYDPASVLVRQEIDQIDPKIPMFWHCIGSQDNHNYMEIDNRGNLSTVASPARREDECLMRLWKFYRMNEKANKRMKGGDVMVKKFKEVLDIDYHEMKESIAVKRYNEKILEQAYFLSEDKSTSSFDDNARYFRAKNSVDDFIHKESTKYENKIRKEAYRIWKRNGAHQNQPEAEQRKDWEASSIIIVCNTDNFLHYTLVDDKK